MSQYPAAHLLGLPFELREAIYDFAAVPDTQHIWDKARGLHLSATQTPNVSLLQAHPILHHEILMHFYRTQVITLHVDAYAFARLRNPNAFFTALQSCHYLRNTKVLDLRPTLNASVPLLSDAMDMAIAVLLSPGFALKKVIVTWAEALPHPFRGYWRPWVCKRVALDSLWELVGRVELTCGGVINPPPAAAAEQDDGFRAFIERLTRNEDLYKMETEDTGKSIFSFANAERDA